MTGDACHNVRVYYGAFFRFLDLGCNGDLRDAAFLTITANRALDLLFGDLSYVLDRLRKSLQEFLLPSCTFP
jgi:hypothetical protein